jgi:hypothetical protein
MPKPWQCFVRPRDYPAPIGVASLAKERGSNTTLDDEFGRDLEAVVSSHREPLTPPA